MNRRARQTTELYRMRFVVVLAVLTLIASALLARLIDVQLINAEFYQREGHARHVRTVPIEVVRGAILDRHGEPLAISAPVDSVWVNPDQALQSLEELPTLAAILGTDPDALVQRIAQRANREFVYLRRQVAPDVAEEIRALEIPGVGLKREYRRFYPAREATSHVLGFTNIDDQGQEGLELAFDEWLAGEAGAKRVVKDRWGRVIQNVELVRESQPGRDLVTSLDRRLQYLAHRELALAIDETDAQSGSVVVMEVASGEVLAMVNYPSYNPNERTSLSGPALRNRAVTDVFEPGSVIKPFLLAAALESGRFRPETVIDTSPGTLQLGAFTIRDYRDYGALNLTGILTKSSNVGISKLALQLEPQHLWYVYDRFGFGRVTGSGFPGESPGILPGHDRWRSVEQAALGYGYGLSTTALQLAQAYSILAAGGELREPTFVHGSAGPASTVIDPRLAGQLSRMMETVTADTGTGTRAALRHYRVAGKTGTARKSEGEGYAQRYVASFAGFAPASHPKLVVVAVINDPASEEYYGGQVAAPVFRRVMDSALRLTNSAPDNLLEEPVYIAGGQP